MRFVYKKYKNRLWKKHVVYVINIIIKKKLEQNNKLFVYKCVLTYFKIPKISDSIMYFAPSTYSYLNVLRIIFTFIYKN